MLQRYELLYEAGLVPEATGRRRTPRARQPMAHDHRRILATGIARLRGQDQIPPGGVRADAAEFTLLQLQHTVEALAGRRLHKQNFRRLIEQQGLVEETGASRQAVAGPPSCSGSAVTC